MNRFMRRIGRLMLNFVIICLVLLVSFQIILKTDNPAYRLREIEANVREFFAGKTGERENAVRVTESETAIRQGTITIDLLQDLSLPEVKIMKNGSRVADFSRGIVTLKVEDGDFLSIDATNYKGILWFEITELSPHIETWEHGKQFRFAGNKKGLGTVKINNKL